jgi:hypothetical protein
VIAAVIGWLACGVLALLPDLGLYNLVDLVAVAVVYVPLLVLVCATYGLPVTLFTVAIVSLVCRRVRPLVVHVVAMGLVAGTLGALWVHLTLSADVHPEDGPWSTTRGVGLLVGVSAACGRLLADRWTPRRPQRRI